jgi:NAD(P)-dependent dehydrogenase (short-subunit alcohol dehydrogenase family)
MAAESAFAALPALIANLVLELAPARVNLIAADFVDTPLSASLLGDELENRRNQLRATDGQLLEAVGWASIVKSRRPKSEMSVVRSTPVGSLSGSVE